MNDKVINLNAIISLEVAKDLLAVCKMKETEDTNPVSDLLVDTFMAAYEREDLSVGALLIGSPGVNAKEFGAKVAEWQERDMKRFLDLCRESGQPSNVTVRKE
jgi:hypothetical protein